MERQPETIQQLVDRYSHCRLANASDNDQILSFLRKQEMKAGSIALDFERGPNFYSFCRLHTDNFFVFLFLNDDNSIGGIGSLLRQTRQLDGHSAPVGYLCDLRLSPHASRKTHIQWRKLYKDVVQHLANPNTDDFCEELFTAIFDDNEKAIRSLTSKLKGVTYEPAGKYKSFTLIGKKPWKPIPKKYSLQTGYEGCKNFVETELKNYRWAPIGSPDESRSHWNNWQDHDWLFLTDAQGEVLGCVKAWEDSCYRQLKVKEAPRALLKVAEMARLFGRPRPQLGETLKILSLPLFVVKKDLSEKKRIEVAKQLLHALWKKSWHQHSHFVQWTCFPSDISLAEKVCSDYFHIPKGGYLFRVYPSEENTPRPDLGSVYFEGSL